MVGVNADVVMQFLTISSTKMKEIVKPDARETRAKLAVEIRL
jgi:hypothetical protein